MDKLPAKCIPSPAIILMQV